MNPLAPDLPEKWQRVSLDYVPTGLDAPWFHAAQGALKRLGEPALSLFDVQQLVLSAVGSRQDAWVRTKEYLALIPDAAWSIDSAWRDRWTKDGRYRPGKVSQVVRDMRSLDYELWVLAYLSAAGFLPVPVERVDGAPDWKVEREGRRIDVEVKTKLALGENLDLIFSAATAIQLLDRSNALRQFRWWLDSDRNRSIVPTFDDSTGRLDRIVTALFQIRQLLSDWILSRPRRSENVTLLTDGNLLLTGRWWEPEFQLDFRFTDDGSEFEIHASPTDHAWTFHPYRATGGALLDRVSEESRAEVTRLLISLLLRREGDPRRGRQMAAASPQTLFVVNWHAPFNWDDALADHTEDLNQVLEELTAAASQYSSRPAIGLLAESFKRTAGRILLNEAGQDLLRCQHLGDPRSSLSTGDF